MDKYSFEVEEKKQTKEAAEKGRCVKCGSEVSGSPPVCPKCGSEPLEKRQK